MSEEEKFDCIIVGAGPAGLTCGIVLAKAGLNVVILERGEYPGAKNLFGGIMFCNVLKDIIPDFEKDAALERPVSIKKFGLLGEKDEISFTMRFNDFSESPHNYSFTALRAKFDQWYAQKAEEAGAQIFPGIVVDDVIIKDGFIKGIKARSDEDGNYDELYADVVVLAEGANSLIPEKLNLKKKYTPKQVILGIKEVIKLDENTIEQRFNIGKNQGCAYEFIGGPLKGMVGSAFVYTNKESISLGIGCLIDSFEKQDKPTYELLDMLEEHPSIKPLIEGGEILEYGSHLIPEPGYDNLTKRVKNGLLVVGDAAGFINPSPIYHEGTNLAMKSGQLAAETIIIAKQKNDFSENTLNEYNKKLDDSFVIKDIKKFGDLMEFVENNPDFINDYPDFTFHAAKKLIELNDLPKEEILKNIRKDFFNKFGYIKPVMQILKLKKYIW